jgi:hypothetical protein
LAFILIGLALSACATSGGFTHGRYLFVGNRSIDVPVELSGCLCVNAICRDRSSGIDQATDARISRECLARSEWIKNLRIGANPALSLAPSGLIELRYLSVLIPYYQLRSCSISERRIVITGSTIELTYLPRRWCDDERIPSGE